MPDIGEAYKNLLALALGDILPPSIAPDPQVAAAGKALDPELQSVSHDIREALIVPRIDELPEEVVDLLAWQWHADFYELALNLAMKREMVKGSIPWHRKKGTRWAILKALEMLGMDATFTPWWEITGGIPYTFEIDAWLLDPDNPTNPNGTETIAAARRAIFMSKAERSWLARLRLGIGFQEEVEVIDDDEFRLERILALTEPYPWPGPLHDGTYSYGSICVHDAAESFDGSLLYDRRRRGTIFHNGGIDSLSLLEIALKSMDEPVDASIYYDNRHYHDRARSHGSEPGPVDDGICLEISRLMRYSGRWLHDQPGFRYNSLKVHDKTKNHEGSGIRNAGTPRIVRI